MNIEKYFGITSLNAASSISKKADNIEPLFNKILSPIHKQADPNLISQLVTSVNTNKDNANLVIDLITNKLKSFQDWEQLISLQILEALVKGCGEPIHDLIARYRFLNEIIKLISPKFYGNKSSEKVKKKSIELLCCWSKGLQNRPKLKAAYAMLKMQGLIKEDPIVDELVINVMPRAYSPVFEDEDKLASLLKSKNPKDLQLANQLIKDMVKKDEIRMDKTMTRAQELEQINNNIKLLNEMLVKFDQKTTNLSEKETIRYLYEELEKMKPKLIQIASEIDENDDTIGEVIKSNDQCELVLTQFKTMFQIESRSKMDIAHADDELINISFDSNIDKLAPISSKPASTCSPKIQSIEELEDLFTFNCDSSNSNDTFQQKCFNLIDDNIKNLNLLEPEVLHKPLNVLTNKILNNPTTVSSSSSLSTTSSRKITAFDDLNILGQVLIENSLKPTSNSNTQSIKINELISKSQNKQIN